MAERVEKSTVDEWKGKDCVFLADWLNTKGLHKLCSVFEGVEQRFIFIVCKYVLSNKPIIVYMHSFRSIIEATEKL